MTANVRKLVLTMHVASSVGWMGGIACFLSLAVSGISQHDVSTLRAAYLAMNWIGWSVLVPLSFASLLSGLAQALGTEWGLFRHYWVLFKLVINVLANIVLVMFMFELKAAIGLHMLSNDALREFSSPAPILHASIGLLLVFTATVLSVYKPRGITPYGWRKLQERASQQR